MHSGRVAFSDWLRGFGLLTIIDHGDGYMSLYAHSDVLYKHVGDRVDTGETIATAGRSGGQTESGLYFEIRSNGAATDPTQVVVAPLMPDTCNVMDMDESEFQTTQAARRWQMPLLVRSARRL